MQDNYSDSEQNSDPEINEDNLQQNINMPSSILGPVACIYEKIPDFLAKSGMISEVALLQNSKPVDFFYAVIGNRVNTMILNQTNPNVAQGLISTDAIIIL